MAVTFDVAYYDAVEAKEFSTRGLTGKFKGLVQNGLQIDEMELLAVGLFNEQYPAASGWTTRQDFRDRANDRLKLFRDYFATAGGSLAANRPAAHMPAGTTEWMGVAASLATLDEAFGLHTADWTKLGVGKQKNLDFQIASTGSNFIVVEAKGSVVDDVSLKAGLSGHKQSIKQKKVIQRTNRPSDVLIGTITAIPQNPTTRARVWLVDPPAPRIDADPFRFKVLARLSFYRDLLRAIGRPHLLMALTNRLRTIAAVSDLRALDRVPLVNVDDEAFDIPPSFLTHRSHSIDQGLVVVTTPTDRGLLLLGLDLSVIPVIVDQEFDRLNAWRSHRSGRSNVPFTLMLSPEELMGFSTGGQGLYGVGPRHVSAECEVYVSRAGLVIGELPWEAQVGL